MYKNNKNPMLVLALAITALSGCAVLGPVEKSTAAINKEADSVQAMIDTSSAILPAATMVSSRNEVFLGIETVKKSDKDMLPESFRDMVAFDIKEPTPMALILDQIFAVTGYRVEFDASGQNHFEDIEDAVEDALQNAGDNENEMDIPPTQQYNMSMPAPIMDIKGLEEFSPEDPLAPFRDLEKEIEKIKAHNEELKGEEEEEEIEEWTPIGRQGSVYKTTLAYTGTLEGVLDTLTAELGLYWKFENNTIILFRNETKSFIVDAVKGSTSFNAEIQTKGSGAGEGGDLNTVKFKQEGKTSIWKEIEVTIDSIISDDESGRFEITEQSGLVTITTDPLTMKRVEEYINTINKTQQQRIKLSTNVYEVFLDDASKLTMDWNAKFLGSNRFSDTVLDSKFPVIGDAYNFGMKFAGSNRWQVDVAIDSLNKLGSVSQVTGVNVITLSGQPIPIKMVRELNYVKSTKVAGGDSPGTELVTDVLTTGFTMTAIPRLTSRGRIMLSMSADLSKLNEMTTLTSEDGGSSVQLPDVSKQKIIERTSLKSGETVMLVGFERTINTAKTNSTFGPSWWWFGGNKEGGKQKVITVVTATPSILSD